MGQRISYRVQDMYQLPKALPRQRFDLVHLRFLIGSMGYPQLLDLATSVTRVCQRGSTIIWHEAELPLTTSRACDELSRLILLAIERSGRNFSFGMRQQIAMMDPIAGP